MTSIEFKKELAECQRRSKEADEMLATLMITVGCNVLILATVVICMVLL